MLNVRSQKTMNKKCDFIIYSCQMQNAFWHLSNLTKTQSFLKSRKYCMYSPFWILSSIGHSTSLKHKYTMFQKAIHTMYVPFDIFFCCHLTFESTFFFWNSTLLHENCRAVPVLESLQKSTVFVVYAQKCANLSFWRRRERAHLYS